MFSRLISVYESLALLVLVVFAYRFVRIIRRADGAPPRIKLTLFGRPSACPACGAPIRWTNQPVCSGCGHAVRIRRSYSTVTAIACWLISGLIAFAVGARGDVWLWLTVLGVLPAGFVVSIISLQLFPPDVEFTGDYRSVLFGRGESDNQPRE